MSTIEQLKAKLTRELDAIHVEIIDDSWKHAGHLEATPGLEATHLTMTVVSPKFEGVGIMDQHRLVHEVLKEAREKHLHALQLKTLPQPVGAPSRLKGLEEYLCSLLKSTSDGSLQE